MATRWRQGTEFKESILRQQDKWPSADDEFVGSMVNVEMAALVTYLLNVYSSAPMRVLQAEQIAEGFQQGEAT